MQTNHSSSNYNLNEGLGTCLSNLKVESGKDMLLQQRAILEPKESAHPTLSQMFWIPKKTPEFPSLLASHLHLSFKLFPWFQVVCWLKRLKLKGQFKKIKQLYEMEWMQHQLSGAMKGSFQWGFKNLGLQDKIQAHNVMCGTCLPTLKSQIMKGNLGTTQRCSGAKRVGSSNAEQNVPSPRKAPEFPSLWVPLIHLSFKLIPWFQVICSI